MGKVILILAVVALSGCVDAFGSYFEAKDGLNGWLQAALIGWGVWGLTEIRQTLTNIDDRIGTLTYLAGEIRDYQLKIHAESIHSNSKTSKPAIKP